MLEAPALRPPEENDIQKNVQIEHSPGGPFLSCATLEPSPVD